MEQRKLSQQSIISSIQQIDTNISNKKEDQIKKGSITPFNFKCQQDQYNVKLCGIVFDAIGAPDFFQFNNVQNNLIDISE
ncbi:unnamed protein product [Paramecium sonneborni]|uniref:Uncharacterized protein n=1 Tax=Paramecium sonneborni TaxID=65129 RepID=A0A8S1RCU0_9CILI|nr:unnamed protein product [Paramecium sonneborni]